MNENRFFVFQDSLPEEFAEEALRPRPRRRPWQTLGALAACFAVAAVVYFALPEFGRTSDLPMTTTIATTEEAAPEAAEEESPAMGPSSRMQAVDESAWATESSVDAGSGEFREPPAAPTVVPPERAEEIEVLCIDGDPSCEETIFRADGVRYTVIVSPVEPSETLLGDAVENTPFELQSIFGRSGEGTVGGIPAILRWNAGDEGQIFWLYDGSLYCLTMDEGASAEALTEMAEQVFVP